MTTRRVLTTLTVTGIAVGGVFTTTPAFAGGVGDFLSPAFGTSCANHNVGPSNTGSTTAGTGTLTGNLAGLPLGSALNQCGGADMPLYGGLQQSRSGDATQINGNIQRFEEAQVAG